MRVFDRTIASIVDENYIYARALNYLGIAFHLCPNRKLGDICRERGLKREMVVQSFYLFDRAHRLPFRELNGYPLEIVIEYLKHSHHLFIKERLPYIANLINQFDEEDDLKLIFPDFVEEFIKHIYEEEDTLFSYIHFLIGVNKKKSGNLLRELWPYRKFSLEQAHEHHQEEDELAGIRALIEERQYDSIHWQVISREIKAFDREMWYHAEIENKILFPKAMILESGIKANLQKQSQLN